MASIGDLIMGVVADMKGFTSSIVKEGEKAGQQAGLAAGKGFGAKMKAAFSGSNLKQGLLGGLGLGAGLTAVNALSAGVGALTDQVFESIDAASNLSEAQAKSNQVFAEGAEEVENWSETTADAFGISKRAALEAAGTYGNLFQAFGIGRKEAQGMSTQLVELAADLASFNNTSVADAIEALRAGVTGETEPLKRYGVALNDVRLKEEAMRLGLIKTAKGVLPVTIKAQAAYSLILKDTALAQGDYARTADGLANTQKSLEAKLEDVQAKIGQKLLPIMLDLANLVKDDILPAFEKFADAINGVGDAAKDNSDPIVNLANLLHDLFKDPDEDARTFLGSLVDGFNDLNRDLGYLASNINDAWTFWDEYTDAAEDARRKNLEMEESLRETSRGLTQMEASGRATASALADGVGAGGPEVTAAITRLVMGVPQALAEMKAKVNALGRETPGQFAARIRERRGEVESAMALLTSTIRENKGPEDAKVLGYLIGDELANALKSKDPLIRATAQDTQQILLDRLAEVGPDIDSLGKKALDILNDALKSKDPDVRRQARAIKDRLEKGLKPNTKSVGQQAANDLVTQLRANEGAIGKEGYRIGRLVGQQIIAGLRSVASTGRPAQDTTPHRAGGGDVEKNQPYWVGENRRPELYVPGADGHIFTEAQVANAAATGDDIAGSTSTSVNLEVYGLPMRASTPAEVLQETRRAIRMGTVAPRRKQGWSNG